MEMFLDRGFSRREVFRMTDAEFERTIGGFFEEDSPRPARRETQPRPAQRETLPRQQHANDFGNGDYDEDEAVRRAIEASLDDQLIPPHLRPKPDPRNEHVSTYRSPSVGYSRRPERTAPRPNPEPTALPTRTATKPKASSTTTATNKRSASVKPSTRVAGTTNSKNVSTVSTRQVGAREAVGRKRADVPRRAEPSSVTHFGGVDLPEPSKRRIGRVSDNTASRVTNTRATGSASTKTAAAKSGSSRTSDRAPPTHTKLTVANSGSSGKTATSSSSTRTGAAKSGSSASSSSAATRVSTRTGQSRTGNRTGVVPDTNQFFEQVDAMRDENRKKAARDRIKKIDDLISGMDIDDRVQVQTPSGKLEAIRDPEEYLAIKRREERESRRAVPDPVVIDRPVATPPAKRAPDNLSASQVLRREQDNEFQEAVRLERQKEENLAKQKRQEEEAKQKAELEKQSKQNDIAYRFAHLPPEPATGTTIAARMLDGTRITRKFNPDDLGELLYVWVAGQTLDKPEEARLSFDSFVITTSVGIEVQKAVSLSEQGIANRFMVIVKEL